MKKTLQLFTLTLLALLTSSNAWAQMITEINILNAGTKGAEIMVPQSVSSTNIRLAVYDVGGGTYTGSPFSLAAPTTATIGGVNFNIFTVALTPAPANGFALVLYNTDGTIYSALTVGGTAQTVTLPAPPGTSGVSTTLIPADPGALTVQFTDAGWVTDAGSVGTLNAGLTSASLSALPAELAAFRATPKNNDVEVSWATASESNNDRFMLQEKIGNEWKTVAEVKGKGTSTVSNTYNKVLQNLPAGLHTFRLAQVDFDGTTKYSEPTQALIELKDHFSMTSAYPNPFNPTTQFALTVAQDQDVRIVLYDMAGREVAVMHNGFMRANEVTYVRLDASNLPSGTYFYHATGKFFNATKTLTLTK